MRPHISKMRFRFKAASRLITGTLATGMVVSCPLLGAPVD
jgi:hypothetical protein